MLRPPRFWHAPPTRPMRWNEANPLSHGLVSLVYCIRGDLFEAGPYGGAGLVLSRISGTGSTYAKNDQGLGGVTAVPYNTVGTTGGDGYRLIYPRAITPTDGPLTVFDLSYSLTADANLKVAVGYMATGAGAVTPRTIWGVGALQRRGVQFSHAGALTSQVRVAADYTAGAPSFMSATKIANSAASIYGYNSGVVMTSSIVNANAAWNATVQEAYIGRGGAGGAANQLNGGVALFGLFTRALDDAEHLALYENPWQLVRPTRSARIFDFGAAAAGGFNPAWAARSNVVISGARAA